MYSYFLAKLLGVRILVIVLLFSITILSLVSAQERQTIAPCNDDGKICSCRNGVVSCDFATLPSTESNRETTFEVDGHSIPTSIKRVCLCNLFKTLRLSLGEGFLPYTNEIHRVDLYNIKGKLDVRGAFQTRFGGELYVENVSNWTRIRRLEFGRGFDLNIIDTRDFLCCSKISAPKLETPALYMKNVNVTFIEYRGIDDMHGWKNIIFNKLRVTHGAEKRAILFGVAGMNVSISILNSEFWNMNSTSLYLRDVANVILARTTFHHSCDPLTLVARSKLDHSSLALIYNVFSNTMILQMDARNIINWFNWYDFWHPTTFSDFGKSDQKARTISMEFNTVEKFLLSESDKIITHDGDSIYLNENILSNCTCPMSTPKILQQYPNRCRNPSPDSNSNKVCLVNIMKVNPTCSSNSQGNLISLCKDKDAMYPTDSISSWTTAKFKAKTINLMSTFISEQLENSQMPIYNHELLRARNGANLFTEAVFIHLFVLCLHLFFKCL